MRLFIAIELPDDFKKIIGNLRADISGARRVNVEQVHLTLAFLGEVEDAVKDLLILELACINLPEFKLYFSGAGCFPDQHRPRVLWIGMEPNQQLQVLADRVRKIVIACGIAQDERTFSPHITMARFRSQPSRELDVFLEQHKKTLLPPFSVQEFTLFQSRLTPQGAVHIPLRNFPLAT